MNLKKNIYVEPMVIPVKWKLASDIKDDLVFKAENNDSNPIGSIYTFLK